MHLLYVYQFYNTPDSPATARHYAYLQTLAQRHRVTLLTAPTYLDARLTTAFDVAPPGVEVRVLPAPYDNAMPPARRLRAYAAFAARALVAGAAGPRPDLVFGISPPLTVAWAAAGIARLRRVPWIFEVNDLWPDFPIQMGAVRSPRLQRWLRARERALYHAAAHVITLSTDMEAHVRRCGVPPARVTTLGHGSDFGLLAACAEDDLGALRRAHGLEGKLVMLYAGTYGRANDIPTLLDAAERLAAHEALRFVFAGYGFHEPLLREAAARLPNVCVLPAQPRHRMLCWFRLADVALVPFIDRPVLAANAPAKFFDSLAAGTPVVVTNDGWTRRFAEAHGCGWYVPPSDAEALAARLTWISDHPEERRRAGQAGAAIAQQQFDRAELVERLDALFQQVAAR